MFEPETWNEAVAYLVADYDEAFIPDGGPLEALYEMDMFYSLGVYAWAELSELMAWSAQDQINLLVSKQTDYGSANIMRFGKEGIKVRLWDKIARYNNLKSKAEPWAENEPLEDTLKDIIGYCVLYDMLSADWMELPLEGQKDVEALVQPEPVRYGHKVAIRTIGFSPENIPILRIEAYEGDIVELQGTSGSQGAGY